MALHYGIQITRPNWGFLSDTRGQRTFWIVAGVAALGAGAIGAALGVLMFAVSFPAAMALSVLSYALIGVGVGAGGTSLLALLATTVEPRRRAAAATITWLMMIFGIAVTAGLSGVFLDPYTPARLMAVVGTVCGLAFLVSILAVHGIERRAGAEPPTEPHAGFRHGLSEIWAEPAARLFTVFVFLSMTAYFMQELILEPYAGLVFGFTPGQSTTLSGAQNGGVFLGMLTVGIAGTGLKLGSMRLWVVAGCLGSAASLALLSALGGAAVPGTLTPAAMTLGFFNGMFAVGAIGAMMALAGQGRGAREGTRMGLWGAAQAIAAGFGGLLGAAMVDAARGLMPDAQAFGMVFMGEAALFICAALMALRVIGQPSARPVRMVPGE